VGSLTDYFKSAFPIQHVCNTIAEAFIPYTSESRQGYTTFTGGKRYELGRLTIHPKMMGAG
jgi:hypothetical protein